MKGGGGNAMRALERERQGIAGGEFGNWWQRTMAQAEAGRGATGSTANVGMNAANNIGSAYMNTARGIAGVQGQKAENINNALNSGVSNILYANYLGK